MIRVIPIVCIVAVAGIVELGTNTRIVRIETIL